jgi:hypothetical protein
MQKETQKTHKKQTLTLAGKQRTKANNQTKRMPSNKIIREYDAVGRMEVSRMHTESKKNAVENAN